jgi:hypothetical protein
MLLYLLFKLIVIDFNEVILKYIQITNIVYSTIHVPWKGEGHRKSTLIKIVQIGKIFFGNLENTNKFIVQINCNWLQWSNIKVYTDILFIFFFTHLYNQVPMKRWRSLEIYAYKNSANWKNMFWNIENTNNILMTKKSRIPWKQNDLIIHYHCLITISELNNDSFLTVSGDSEIISYVHIRLNTLKKISCLLKIDLNKRY